MTTRYRLHVTPPQGEPFDRVFDSDEFVIGRASTSDLPLSDRFLSRHHARLFRRDGDVFVEDLGSRNGTLLNGKPVESPTRVAPGDVITMCGSVVAIEGDRDVDTKDRLLDSDLGGQTLFRPVAELLDSSSRIEAAEIDSEPELRNYADRLRLLNEVHQALGRSMELDELLDLILEKAFAELRPEEGAIYLKHGDGSLSLAASRSVPGLTKETLYSRSLIKEVTEKGVGALVYDVESDERFASAQSILTSGVRSLVAAPLLDQEGSLGMIVLNSRAAVRHFSEDDLDLLISLASVAALRLRNVKLAEEAAERRLLEKELALARRIQVALLPNELPEIDGWELFGQTVPSRTVSGDYFEILERNTGDVFLFVADVSGKGIAASLLTASLEALAAGPIEEGLGPHEICSRVGVRLHRRTPPEKYATAFLAATDPETGRTVYANAGHNPALVVRADGSTEHLGATGTPLGLLPVASWEAETITLDPGDTLFVYTDACTEAVNPDDEEFGLERLEESCRNHRDKPLREWAAAVEDDLEHFGEGIPTADDLTIVMARRKAE